MAKKLPASVLEAKGSFDHDPQRRRKDPVAFGDLGGSPAYFTKPQVEIWEELKQQLPVGLAKSADRSIFEIVCRLMEKFRTTKMSATETALLINALAKLGMSPSDRSKCAVPVVKDDSKNEFADF